LIRANTTDPTRLTLTALRDLLAEPDDAVDYVVADRIAFGSLNLLSGKPKAGKSTLARALAFEVSRGGVWLGSACVSRPVWYVALEDKRSEVRRHFRAMGATGVEAVRFLFPQAGAVDLLRELHGLAAREHPGLVVVDTLQRLIRAEDLNDYAEVTTKLTPLLALARDTGAAVLLVHHAGKAERLGVDAVLGSTALTGSVDNVFVLSRTDRYRVLMSVQRIGPDMAETVVALDEQSGEVRPGLTRRDADVRAVESMLVAALKSAPQTRAELLDQVEARRQLKLEALRRAVESGTITRSGAGTKSAPHVYSLGVDSDSGSQVPANTREPESSSPSLPENVSALSTDCGSRVPTVPNFRAEPDASDCPVCGRDSCENDLTECLRRRVPAFGDLEDVFGRFDHVTAERVQ
jgi:hypothetical protein